MDSFHDDIISKGATLQFQLFQVFLKSVQSALSHLITTSVPSAMFTNFLVEHGLPQCY